MAAPLEQDEEDLLQEDYYTLLNVGREATPEEINRAYKQLSKIYHPDKHVDPVKKRTAELLFNKLKRAHEVLSDEHKRVVYNLYGEKGLETYGLEVISRTKTPAEIIAEYERFQQEQEERRLQQRTNPRSSVVIGVNATDLFEGPVYDYDDEEEEDIPPHIPSIELTTLNINQTVECPLTSQNTVTLGGNVTVQNGRGVGTFKTMWRRLLASRGTIEVEATVGNKPTLICRFSKHLFKRCTGNFHAKLVTENRGIGLNVGTGISYNFDKNWVGKIKYNILAPSSINTFLIYNSETQQLVMQVMLSVRSSYVYASYTRKFQDYNAAATISAKAGVFGALFEYGVERKITSFSTVGASMSIGVPTGVMVRLKLERGQHLILMPISLSEELVPSAMFYGTIVPILSYFAVKKLIIDPYISGQKQKDLERKKQEQQEKIQQRKKEAESLIELMTETVERSIEVEERKNGLVIIKALYGKLTAGQNMELANEDCISVTIPLQALIKESKLISPEMTSKSSLPGFYDPCLGEEKKLYIKYKFRRKLHHVTLQDGDSIRLPQQKHIMKDDDMSSFLPMDELDT